MNTYIPEGYQSLLGVYDTQKAIGLLKRLFEDQLAANLNLFRVSAPLFLEESSGLNDNLNGYERPVSFDILQTGREAQVVQSLAKWKRMALYRYDFYPGKGLYTDMNAIRRDEDVLDNLHSTSISGTGKRSLSAATGIWTISSPRSWTLSPPSARRSAPCARSIRSFRCCRSWSAR